MVGSWEFGVWSWELGVDGWELVTSVPLLAGQQCSWHLPKIISS
ncbi:hypothetical protein Plim_3356 [Planctopirus limnophila DSM 3776]|uniref:Uncharacterized protein n=1 Tax=Planctopirus limnophila (strain ATCC 43296 / DSM 3776 / IFAM 1008 / Mu 290) TaxID=521674 RepID=D5SUB6_PLAL2|nr:hypothetical protein Plim_3356 [Planctopirus limnophila DSM 3776]